jgi:nucleoside permease NupC
MQLLHLAVVVAVRMIDPLSLVIALVIAWIASGQKTEVRWAIIGVGVILVTMGFAALDHAAPVADGRKCV